MTTPPSLDSLLADRQRLERELGESRRRFDDLVAATADGVGDAFLHRLVQGLAETLGAEYAFAGEIPGEDLAQVCTVAVYARGQTAPNFTYDLAGTPCENVVGNELCAYPRDVQTLFPRDHLLVEMGVHAYVGSPLWDVRGRVIGLLVVLFARPLEETGAARALLRIFAARASAEIERKRYEAALEESQRSLMTLIGNLPGMVYRCRNDPDWTMEFVSDGVRALLGYAPEDLVGSRRVVYGDLIHPADRGPVWDAVQAGLADDRRYTLTFRLRTAGGEEKTVWEQGVGVYGPQGELTALEGFITDITQQVRAEEERASLAAQLRQAQKLEAVGQLAAGVAHDFNNLLTVILGQSEFLLPHAGDPRTQRGLAEIHRAGERAADLTRQLLAFSRKQVVQPRVVDVNQAVGGAETLLRRLIGEDISLAFTPGASVGRVRIDPGQLEQVIVNLAVNARDAMPQGGTLTLATASTELAEPLPGLRPPTVTPGPYAVLSVSDTGIGMDAATRERLFDPFFTTKEPGRGTGLGLATAYGIVTQAGGHLSVYSEPGHGSTFRVYLPRLDSPADRTEPSAGPLPRGDETILLVEDDPAVRQMVEAMLQSLGYTVLAAGGAAEAEARSAAHPGPVHLLITDVVMPGLGGRALAERLAATIPDAKVLYVSGYTDDAVLRHGVRSREVAFLQKPFTRADLARAVRAALARLPPAETQDPGGTA